MVPGIIQDLVSWLAELTDYHIQWPSQGGLIVYKRPEQESSGVTVIVAEELEKLKRSTWKKEDEVSVVSLAALQQKLGESIGEYGGQIFKINAIYMPF